MTELEKKYNQVCQEYVDLFCEKQEMDFEHWVGSQFGGVVVCSDMYFNFQDLVWDVNSKQPKDLITEWYYETLDNPERSINYYSYSQGLRYEDIKN